MFENFSFQSAIKLDRWGLELWPGYVTSIRQHENDLLLCCEISHKVLRSDTVLDQMKLISQKYRNDIAKIKEECLKALVGCVIITKYNHKNYNIADIDFGQRVTSKFQASC